MGKNGKEGWCGCANLLYLGGSCHWRMMISCRRESACGERCWSKEALLQFRIAVDGVSLPILDVSLGVVSGGGRLLPCVTWSKLSCTDALMHGPTGLGFVTVVRFLFSLSFGGLGSLCGADRLVGAC